MIAVLGTHGGSIEESIDGCCLHCIIHWSAYSIAEMVVIDERCGIAGTFLVDVD